MTAQAARPGQQLHPEPRLSAQSPLVQRLVRAGVRTVFAHPSIQVDGALAQIAAEPGLDLVVAASELDAARAAHGYAAACHRPVAVVADIRWGFPDLLRPVASAGAESLPVIYALLGGDANPPAVPFPEQWRGVDLARGTGRRVWIVPADARSESKMLDETGRSAQEAPAGPRVLHSPEVVLRSIAAGRRRVLVLPPPADPRRHDMLRVATGWALPVATVSATDPFPRQHPDLWAGRFGFVPSQRLWQEFGPRSSGGSGLVCVDDWVPPSWIRAAVLRCDAAGLARASTRSGAWVAVDQVGPPPWGGGGGGLSVTGAGLVGDCDPGAAAAAVGDVGPQSGGGGGGGDGGSLSVMGAGLVGACEPASVTAVPPDGSASPLARAVRDLSAGLPDAVFVADAGAAHRVVAQEVANRGRPAVMTSDPTPMGWALPVSLGVGVATRAAFVAVVGDGSAVVSGTGLAVLRRHRVGCVVLLARNGTLGRRAEPQLRLAEIDWVALAAAMDVPGEVLEDSGVTAGALARAMDHVRRGRPYLLVVDTPPAHPEDYSVPVGIAALDRMPG